MPQTLSVNLMHIIFTTKQRAPLINDDVGANLHAYLAGTARRLDLQCFRVGGVGYHVRLAMRPVATKTAARAAFAWERGYALFSFGPAAVSALLNYIDGQAAHHLKRDLQDEMRAFF
jgi:REP element-mobilizing transposase RayT